MSTRLLELGLSRPVAVGLHWIVGPASGRKQARKGLLGKVYAVAKPQGTTNFAFGDDPERALKSHKALCGAALVALADANCFVYHELPPDPTAEPSPEPLVWICGIRNGEPGAGFDEVCVKSEALSKYSEFMSFAQCAVYGSLTEAEMSLAELLGKLKPREIKQCLLRPTGIQVGHAIVGLVALSMTLAGAVWIKNLEEKRKREQLEWDQMVKTQVATEAERRRLANLRAEFEAKRKAKIEELAAQRDPSQDVDQWLNFLAKDVPISFNGWSPLRANCRKDGCTVTWKPALQALPIDGRNLPGQRVNWTPHEVTTSFALSAGDRYPKAGVDDEFRFRLMSMANVSAGTANVTSAPDPAPVVVHPPAELAKEIPPATVGTMGTFKATFTNLVALREFVKLMKPYAVELDQMEATAFAPNVGSPGWSLEGRYVVRQQ